MRGSQLWILLCIMMAGRVSAANTLFGLAHAWGLSVQPAYTLGVMQMKL